MQVTLDAYAGQAAPNTIVPNTATTLYFNDFVRDALWLLWPVTILLVWGWAGLATLFDPARSTAAYLNLGILFVTALTNYHLIARSLQWTVACYLAGLTAMITILVISYGNSANFALYLTVVLVAAALTSALRMWLVTAAIAVLLLAVGWRLQLAPRELLLPLILLLLTALTAWLSARRLFSALEWALTMTEHEQRSTAEARTHRGELQRALQSLDIALSRLERANRSLVFAQEAAEKAYRFKSEFVANVSHELRTPLNLIVGFTEMMATAPESYGGLPLPKEYRGDMLATYRSARHLLDLINDVLDLSQIEAGRMAILKERTSLHAVVNEAVEIVRGLADARKLSLLVELPAGDLQLDLDRTRIRQVLLNLLTNAMRYTERGWVRVTAAVISEPTAEQVTLRVADSGRGIAPEKLARAFEAFDRLDEEQLTQGSGLGLAVSKKFVELHDGRMWIESALESTATQGGTTVHLTLPLPSSAEKLPLGKLRLSHPLVYENGTPLVLVLHDDPRALSLLRRYVDECEFVLATTATAAQEQLEHAEPNVVIVDKELLPLWKAVVMKMPAASHLPVLICHLPSMRQVGISLGATDYLPKPVSRDDLALVLARLPTPPRTALVVDDDPHIVRLIGRMLRAIAPELRILEAFDGAAALSIALAQQLDVVFVDLMMPGMNGTSFIHAARREVTLATLPIVVVSVRSAEQESTPLVGELRLERENGFSLTELLAMLQTLLNTLTRPGGVRKS